MMMPQILTSKGNQDTASSLRQQLVNLNPNDKYAWYKAIGSMGGSIRHGFIKKVAGQSNTYYRTR